MLVLLAKLQKKVQSSKTLDLFLYLSLIIALEATTRAAETAATEAAAEAATTLATTEVATIALATLLVATTLLIALRSKQSEHLLRSECLSELFGILLLNFQTLLHGSDLLFLTLEVLLDSCLCIFCAQFFTVFATIALFSALALELVGCEHFLLVGCVGLDEGLLCIVLQLEVTCHAIGHALDAFCHCCFTFFCAHTLLGTDYSTAHESQDCQDNSLFHLC